MNLLQSKLEETKVTRNELTQTVRNMLGNDYYRHHVSFMVEYIHTFVICTLVCVWVILIGWWIIVESEILLLKLDQKQKEKKAAIIKESDFEIIPESKDQVCGILNISDSEFKSIMNAHESGKILYSKLDSKRVF